MIDIRTCSEEETIAWGAFLGVMLREGDVLALRGDLGAGKTHFVQGIARGMGISAPVVSPTFTILNYYDHHIPLQHIDFYRLEEEYELDDIGFDECLGRGVIVIEWSEKFPDRIPEEALTITIEKTGLTERVFHLEGKCARWQEREKEVRQYAAGH